MVEKETKMSAIRCAKCGGLTNTAVSQWCDPKIRKDKLAYECYLRVGLTGRWEEGCGWENANKEYELSTLKTLLGRTA